MGIKEKVKELIIKAMEEYKNVPPLQPYIADTEHMLVVETDKLNMGLVNYLYRVKASDGSTMVAKYVPPYIKAFGESMPLTDKRMNLELFALQKFFNFSPNSVPLVYCCSFTHNIILMEELKNYEQMRVHLMKGNVYTFAIKNLAKHLANIHSATHILNMNPDEFEKLKDSMKEHDSMILGMVGALTQFVCITNPPDDLSRRLGVKGQEILSDPGNEMIMTEFTDNYVHDKQCLIHGFLHLQDVLCNHENAKLIDPEFAHVGPDYMDICLVVARMIVQYFYHLTHLQDNEVHRKIAHQIAENCKLFVNSYLLNIRWHVINKIEYEKILMVKLSRAVGAELVRSVLTNEEEGLGESLFETLEAGRRVMTYCQTKPIDNIDKLMVVALALT